MRSSFQFSKIFILCLLSIPTYGKRYGRLEWIKRPKSVSLA